MQLHWFSVLSLNAANSHFGTDLLLAQLCIWRPDALAYLLVSRCLFTCSQRRWRIWRPTTVQRPTTVVSTKDTYHSTAFLVWLVGLVRFAALQPRPGRSCQLLWLHNGQFQVLQDFRCHFQLRPRSSQVFWLCFFTPCKYIWIGFHWIIVGSVLAKILQSFDEIPILSIVFSA